MRWKRSIPFWFIFGLLVALGFLGWKIITNYHQTVTAMFISAQCETAERNARDFPDPKAIAHDVEFLICYYQGHSKTLAGTRLAGVVRRDYEHTLTNAVISYQRVSTNDFRTQIEAWSQKYAR